MRVRHEGRAEGDRGLEDVAIVGRGREVDSSQLRRQVDPCSVVRGGRSRGSARAVVTSGVPGAWTKGGVCMRMRRALARGTGKKRRTDGRSVREGA